MNAGKLRLDLSAMPWMGMNEFSNFFENMAN